MKITLKKTECMDDWYQIVRAEHDGREWFEELDTNCFSFMKSERLVPDACIEGSGSEMVAIALAIKARKNESFKRCAVDFEQDSFHFCSPRNSSEDGVVSVEDADTFADEVLIALKSGSIATHRAEDDTPQTMQ